MNAVCDQSRRRVVGTGEFVNVTKLPFVATQVKVNAARVDLALVIWMVSIIHLLPLRVMIRFF